jgi:hypothetical protein
MFAGFEFVDSFFNSPKLNKSVGSAVALSVAMGVRRSGKR